MPHLISLGGSSPLMGTRGSRPMTQHCGGQSKRCRRAALITANVRTYLFTHNIYGDTSFFFQIFTSIQWYIYIYILGGGGVVALLFRLQCLYF